MLGFGGFPISVLELAAKGLVEVLRKLHRLEQEQIDQPSKLAGFRRLLSAQLIFSMGGQLAVVRPNVRLPNHEAFGIVLAKIVTRCRG